MDVMLAVELHTTPIDEVFSYVVAGAPGGGHAQRIRVEHHPVPAARYAPCAGIKSHSDTLVGKVVLSAGHFIGMCERRAVVHGRPLLQLGRVLRERRPLSRAE